MAGFTLVELIVVLAIMGLVAGLGVPAYSKIKAGAEYRNAVRLVMAGLLGARQQAVASGQSRAFSCDLTKRLCGPEGSLTQSLPAELTLKATVAGIEMKDGSLASIRFYPDGGSTGGNFELRRAGGGGVRLRVEWLFGQVSQEAIGP